MKRYNFFPVFYFLSSVLEVGRIIRLSIPAESIQIINKLLDKNIFSEFFPNRITRNKKFRNINRTFKL